MGAFASGRAQPSSASDIRSPMQPLQVSSVSPVLGYCHFQFLCSATKHYSAWGRCAFKGIRQLACFELVKFVNFSKLSKMEQRRDGGGPKVSPSPPLIGIYR